jgi:hypothetical protein
MVKLLRLSRSRADALVTRRVQRDYRLGNGYPFLIAGGVTPSARVYNSLPTGISNGPQDNHVRW